MSSENPQLRVGLMSFAHVHATSYLNLLSEMEDVDLICSDPDGSDTDDPTRGRSFADSLGIAYVDTYDELFDLDLDAVVICSENTRHRELVELAAAHGVHALCEKPLATTVADARAMIAACEKASVILMVAYPVRFSPDFVSLKAALASGSLGDPLIISGTNNGKIPVGERAWFCDPEFAGGGCLVDHTVHVADLVDALRGENPIRVRAVSNQILHRDKREVKAETGGLVHITYDSGLTLVVDCSWSVPDNNPTWGGLTLDIVTNKTLACIAPFDHSVQGHSSTAGGSLFYGFGVNTDRIMLEEFLRGVRRGDQPQPDGYSGLRTTAIVEAALKSASTNGEPVDIDLS